MTFVKDINELSSKYHNISKKYEKRETTRFINQVIEFPRLILSTG